MRTLNDIELENIAGGIASAGLPANAHPAPTARFRPIPLPPIGFPIDPILVPLLLES